MPIQFYLSIECLITDVNCKNMNIWFAWYPVKTIDGKYVWLKRVGWEYDVDAIRGNEMIGLAQLEYFYTEIKESK